MMFWLFHNTVYYIRRVSPNGKVLEEVEVKVGIISKGKVSISGAEEGWYCDPGYARLMNESIRQLQ